MSGSAGLWGPSCLACAELARDEINRDGGIGGREVTLEVVDAGGTPEAIADAAELLVDGGRIDAIVGMHISAVRQALARRVGGLLPYVYTPLYEGGETTPGVYAIGETPAEQLRPALAWLTQHRKARRWALLGNDYVWPRVSNALARRYLGAAGAEVLDEAYVPLGTERFDDAIQQLADLSPDAVLLSLVGQDSVLFNRAFGASPLARRTVRLSTAIDENMLLAIGGGATEDLYVASGYFMTLSSDRHLAFKERYRQRFGLRAPVLSALGQSTYEGLGFLGGLWPSLGRSAKPVRYRSVRGGLYLDNLRKRVPIFLARADGHRFEVLSELDARTAERS
jgi:ABC-type branched-subunit amino acid transport system substrate-binding protein